MKNYKEQVLSMMNLEVNTPFTLRDNEHNQELPGRYFINDSMDIIEEHTNLFFASIKHLIIGNFSVIKDLTEKEKIAIEYAKACGCNWIAEDESGIIYAYTFKPKKTSFGYWESDTDNDMCIKICLPISFIHWEDEEPYKI